jgi:hypothetical protein
MSPIARAVAQVLLQAQPQGDADVRRYRWRKHLVIGLALQHLRQRQRHVLIVEGAPAGQHFV